ncbi:MAG: FmdB family zinc ribbon protein [Acidimicrobiales bacterium]
MPTYEYACTSCGEHIEVVQSFRDEPLAVCPSCGGPLRKVFGSIGVVFKGSGFYKTDNRSSSGAGKAERSETAGASDKSEKSDKSGDSSAKSSDSSSGKSSEGSSSSAAGASKSTTSGNGSSKPSSSNAAAS